MHWTRFRRHNGLSCQVLNERGYSPADAGFGKPVPAFAAGMNHLGRRRACDEFAA